MARVVSKQEFAEILCVSPTTLRRWLNVRYYETLRTEYHYYKYQRFLTTKQMNYLIELLCSAD